MNILKKKRLETSDENHKLIKKVFPKVINRRMK